MCTKTNQGESYIFKASSSASHQMGQSNEESCQEQVSLSQRQTRLDGNVAENIISV